MLKPNWKFKFAEFFIITTDTNQLFHQQRLPHSIVVWVLFELLFLTNNLQTNDAVHCCYNGNDSSTIQHSWLKTLWHSYKKTIISTAYCKTERETSGIKMKLMLAFECSNIHKQINDTDSTRQDAHWNLQKVWGSMPAALKVQDIKICHLSWYITDNTNNEQAFRALSAFSLVYHFPIMRLHFLSDKISLRRIDLPVNLAYNPAFSGWKHVRQYVRLSNGYVLCMKLVIV